MLRKGISYKKMTAILAIAIPIVSFIVWHRSIEDTFQLANEATELEIQVSNAMQARTLHKNLKSRIYQLDAAIGKSSESASIVQKEILGLLGLTCKKHGLELKEFPAPTSTEHTGYQITTSSFQVEGDYKGIVILAHHLETNFPLARVAGIDLQSSTNRRTKKTVLHATFFLQHATRYN